MTDTQTLTWRERQRLATMTEIVAVSRRLLGEPHGISLRAIASEMGMTAPALYRYVDSYDDLIQLVAASIYDDVVAALEAARDRYPADDPAARIVAASTAFRQWSLAHRAEFGLIFANPTTSSLTDGNKVCAQAGARFGGLFSELFIQNWTTYRFPIPGDDELDPAFRDRLRAGEADHSGFHAQWQTDGVPLGLQWMFLRIWSRLYGTVTLEVFEHVDTMVVESGILFADMVAGCGREMGMASEESRLRDVLVAELSR